MKRNNILEEYGSVLKYVLIALLVIVLFFVCFAFSRSGKDKDKPEETTTESPIDNENQTPEETTPEETTPEETTTEEEPETVVSEDGMVFTVVDETVYTQTDLFVRKAPTTEAGIWVVLDPGAQLHRIGVSADGWSMISYDGRQLFVASRYVGKEAP